MTTKLILTTVMPGASLLSEKVCESDPTNNYENCSLCLETPVKKGRKDFINREWIRYRTRKCAEVSQVTNICTEAYEYFQSDSCPEWSFMGEWKKMSKEQRLIAHLDRICKSLGGKYFRYEILPD